MSTMAAAARAGTSKQTISYGAFYKAYSESGERHFNGYVDALRELVDNSVQYALDGNTQPGENPEIIIIISLKGPPKDYTVAVGDNGRGMNEEHLTDFLQCVARTPVLLAC
jgi:DNA topoisomerase VI subunit B